MKIPGRGRSMRSGSHQRRSKAAPDSDRRLSRWSVTTSGFYQSTVGTISGLADYPGVPISCQFGTIKNDDIPRYGLSPPPAGAVSLAEARLHHRAPFMRVQLIAQASIGAKRLSHLLDYFSGRSLRVGLIVNWPSDYQIVSPRFDGLKWPSGPFLIILRTSTGADSRRYDHQFVFCLLANGRGFLSRGNNAIDSHFQGPIPRHSLCGQITQ
jgi:hypothetical protein